MSWKISKQLRSCNSIDCTCALSRFDCKCFCRICSKRRNRIFGPKPLACDYCFLNHKGCDREIPCSTCKIMNRNCEISKQATQKQNQEAKALERHNFRPITKRKYSQI